MKAPLSSYWPEMTRVVDRRIRKEELPIPSPWPHLNETLGGGFWPGLHPIISSPGNGKTTFAVQVAAYAAMQGFETYYASLELDETQIVLRMAAALHGKLSWKNLFLGSPTQREELDSMYRAKVKDLPLTLDTGDPNGWRIEEIETWLTESVPNQTRLVVIDYLQLANAGDGEEATSRVSTLTRRLQDIARLNNAAIIAISSTSRSNYDEQRLFEESAVQGTNDGNTGAMRNRSTVMKMAKESGEVEFGATSLSALVRQGMKTYLLIAKRRLDDGGVWCSFTFKDSGFREDAITAGPSRPPRISESEREAIAARTEAAFARALERGS